VLGRLKTGWSPEQIAGRLKVEPFAPLGISHETIYQFIYSKDGREKELGKLLVRVLTAGQVSDRIGAKIMYPSLPNATILIGDKGYDSDEFRAAKSQGDSILHSAKIRPKQPGYLFQNLVQTTS
jgi:hypothetical protein